MSPPAGAGFLSTVMFSGAGEGEGGFWEPEHGPQDHQDDSQNPQSEPWLLGAAAGTLRFIGGGRRFFDGSGGSNGALDHFAEAAAKKKIRGSEGWYRTDREPEAALPILG